MSKPAPISTRVERVIEAPAAVIYDLVSDVTRMGEWSPETLEASWLGDATGAEVGARFKGRNTLGPNNWSTKPTVTAATRGEVFAFKVPGRAGAEWRYEFHPVEHGTRVVESVQQAKRSPLPIRLLQRRAGVTDREQNLREGMQATLANLAAAATAS